VHLNSFIVDGVFVHVMQRIIFRACDTNLFIPPSDRLSVPSLQMHIKSISLRYYNVLVIAPKLFSLRACDTLNGMVFLYFQQELRSLRLTIVMIMQLMNVEVHPYSKVWARPIYTQIKATLVGV